MKILIGTSVLGIHKEIPPYVSYLLKTKAFLRNEIKLVPYGAQKSNEKIGEKFLMFPIRLFYFLFEVAKFRPDIIHLNSAFDKKAIGRDIVFLAFLKIFRQKVCIEFHGTDLEWFDSLPSIQKVFILKALKKIDAIFFLSTEEQNYFRKNFDIKLNSAIVKVPIKNSFDITNINDGNINLLFVGRLLERKGIIELLEAVNKILKTHDMSCKLYIAGDGPLKKHIDEFVNKHGLTNTVIRLGWLTNVEVLKQYEKATIFVLPTYHQEGLPIVVLMALQYGVPIITTKIRGMADYLKEPENCLWVEPENFEMLAEKIIFLIKNQHVRVQMSKNNRELAKQFAADRVAEEFIEMYEKILT